MKYKKLLVLVLSLVLLSVVSGSDQELIIIHTGDEQLYIQPILGDSEINVYYVSPYIPLLVVNETNVTDNSAGSGESAQIFEEVKVEVISSKNVPGGYVIGEVNITNRRSYSITNIVLTSYLSNVNGDKFSETKSIIDKVDPGTYTFHQNLTIPKDIELGGYKFNVMYEKMTYSSEGAQVLYRSDSFDFFEITEGFTRPVTITIMLTILGLLGVILFMYFFNKRLQRVERKLVPIFDDEDDEEAEEEKENKKTKKTKKKSKNDNLKKRFRKRKK